MSATRTEQLEARYNNEVRFHDLVNYMIGVIRSGAFTGSDLRDVVLLAADKAEAERVKIPSHRTQTTQER